MTTVGNTALTLFDHASRVDDSGKTQMVVEMLSQDNAFVRDALTLESNMTTGHKTTQRTGLPAVYWRSINQGVPLSKSTTAPIVDEAGMLEAESQIDVKLVRMQNDPSMFRLTESMAFIQAMGQEAAQTFIYGNAGTAPQEFTGLAPRYSDKSVPSGANIVDGGGTGSDNTSIWFVTWGVQTMHCFFPRNTRAGLTHTPYSSVDAPERVFDGDGNPYYAVVDHYEWNLGLTLRDWRYNVRIANIDVSELAGGTPAALFNLMIIAANLLPTTSGQLSAVTESDGNLISGMMGKTVIYVNRTIRTWMEIQAKDNNSNTHLTITETVEGMVVLKFRGIPIHTMDVILDTEERVT